MILPYLPHTLPQELLDLFIDELGSQASNGSIGKLALRSCLMVSRSFCHRVRHHLFSSIIVTHNKNGGVTSRTQTLLEILHSELPIGGVAPYIVKVTFSIVGDPERILGDRESSLISFLSAMHGHEYGINDLSLVVFSGLGGLDWNKMNVDLQHCLQNAFQSPHLQALALLDVYSVPPMVLLSTHLKNLRIKIAGHQRTPKFADAHTPTILKPFNPRLETFKTDHSYPVEFFGHDCISTSSPFINLLSLESSPANAQDLKDCFKILDIAAQTIQKVQFAFFSGVPKPSRPLDLARLHSLRNLEFKMQPLRLGTRVFGAGLDAGFEQLYNFLDSPSPSCDLRFISFSITASEGYPRDELFLVAEDSKWLALDTLLSGPKFSSVQTVSVSLSLTFRSGASDKLALITKMRDFLKKAFPTVLTSKSLKIEANIVR